MSSYSNPNAEVMAINFSMERLADQVVHAETLNPIYKETRGPSGAEIKVNMQWLYSRSKFYTDIIDLTDKELKTHSLSKADAEENLRLLYLMTPSTAKIAPVKVNFASVARFNEMTPKVTSSEPTLGASAKGSTQAGKASMSMCMLIVVLAIFSSLIKAQFLDVRFGQADVHRPRHRQLCALGDA